MAGSASAGAEGGPALRYAWAKVNLYLHVTGRRDDGFHELDSLIVFAGVGDRLSAEPAERFALSLAGPFAGGLEPEAENLVARAAGLLADAEGRLPPTHIRLEKHLPVAAGLGGGSADAAAALALLGARLGPGSALDWPVLAARLGADVPVCCYGRPAFVGGIGEIVERAPPLPAAWLVLANPGIALSTADVFRRLEGRRSPPMRWDAPAGSALELADRLLQRGNDLEGPARALQPAIDGLLDAIAATEGCLLARMSGSGASCFGLYAERAEAQAAAEALRAAEPARWAAAAPLLHGPLERSWWETAAAAG